MNLKKSVGKNLYIIFLLDTHRQMQHIWHISGISRSQREAKEKPLIKMQNLYFRQTKMPGIFFFLLFLTEDNLLLKMFILRPARVTSLLKQSNNP